VNWRIFDAGPGVFPESTLWDAAREGLWWLDIHARLLCFRSLNGQTRKNWPVNDEPGALLLDADGRLLLGGREALWRFHPDTESLTRLIDAPFNAETMRFNDAGVSPTGEPVFSSLYDPKDAARAGLFRYDGAGFERLADDVITGNTPVWNRDGSRLYWADTRGHRILCFDVSPASGRLNGRRVHWSGRAFSPGRPDGMALDSEDCLWVALFEGAAVVRISPTGELLRVLPVPALCPTRPAFGGPDLRTLFLATAGTARPAGERHAYPCSGAILALCCDIAGHPPGLARPGSAPAQAQTQEP
jgi:sugar lactone lactonase YvrE